MTLALAIPIKNDHAALTQLLRQARRMGVFDQVVIVDDGSAPPIDIDGGRFGPWALPISALRNPVSAGPGMARNLAVERIVTDHFVYLDSDDQFTPEFARIWHAASVRDFDLCLFRHHDSRQERIGRRGQMPRDENIWRRAGLDQALIATVDEPALIQLAETANYPWNKIYRTDFLRENGLGCATTLVHEDIKLHWDVMLRAQKVLASAQVGVVHHVADNGARLTNRRGAERLEVFDVLQKVLGDLMAARKQRDLVPAFLRFVSSLFEWIRAQIRADLAPKYRTDLREFLVAIMPPALLKELAGYDPVLSLRLILQMADGAMPDRPAA